jgi:hypothetical protein
VRTNPEHKNLKVKLFSLRLNPMKISHLYSPTSAPSRKDEDSVDATIERIQYRGICLSACYTSSNVENGGLTRACLLDDLKRRFPAEYFTGPEKRSAAIEKDAFMRFEEGIEEVTDPLDMPALLRVFPVRTLETSDDYLDRLSAVLHSLRAPDAFELFLEERALWQNAMIERLRLVLGTPKSIAAFDLFEDADLTVKPSTKPSPSKAA